MSEVVLAGAGVIGLTAVLVAAMARVPVVTDEAWFLQVLTRYRHGDLLYRDVFYGAGPLPVWIGRLVVAGRRRPMGALRALSVGYFVGLLVAGTWVLDGAGTPPALVAAFWVGSLAFAPPTSAQENHYTRLALLAGVVAAGAVVHAGPSGAPPWFALAGIASGVSFSAKQTIGLATTAAAAGVAFDAGGAEGAVWCLLGAVAVAGGCLVPLAVTGALGWYVRRSFVNKTSYLATGRMGLREGIAEAMERSFPDKGQKAAYATVLVTAYLLLGAVVVACAGALRSIAAGGSATRAADLATLVLGAVVVSAAIPRADFPHVRGLLPVALLAVVLTLGAHPSALDALPAAAAGAGVGAAVVVTALALAISARRVQVALASAGPVDRAAPHFEGQPVALDARSASPADVDVLRDRTGGAVFLLRADASFWYLAGGLTNPTPYDYPFASVFGPRGQQEVIEGIRTGRVAWVCSPGPTTGRLRPTELEEFVAASMEAVEDTPAGVLYRLAPDASAGGIGPVPRRS
jgi:hypothetical protein